MEATHKLVRENIAGAMLRQKSLYDQRVTWRSFKNDDEVYVFFPRHKVGQSPKLTSFWRGPFKVIEKCTDVTYKIPCGRRGKPQVIHVDRIKAKKQQILSFERPENRQGDVIIDIDFEEEDELSPYTQSNVGNESLAPNTHRVRKPPIWMSDYVTKY